MWLLLALACQLDSAPDPWICDDNAWTWTDVVVEDGCAGSTGDTWFADSEITCVTDTTFAWRVGVHTFACEADGRDFDCNRARPEGVLLHAHALRGRFVDDDTAQGSWSYRRVAPDDTCQVRYAFEATRW